MHDSICVCLPVLDCVHVCVYVCACVYVCPRVFLVCLCVFVLLYVFVCIRVYTDICARLCSCVFMHTFRAYFEISGDPNVMDSSVSVHAWLCLC